MALVPVAASSEEQREALTYDEVQEWPEDDSDRHELLDGFLLVSPGAGLLHQRCVLGLAVLLRQAVLPELEVFIAPFDWYVDQRTFFEPDVLVVRRDATDERRVLAPPPLVVEVLSPTSRGRDLALKRAAYERHGAGAYWVVDPELPELRVLERGEDGRFAEVARVAGDDVFDAEHPFPVAVVPSQLVL